MEDLNTLDSAELKRRAEEYRKESRRLQQLSKQCMAILLHREARGILLRLSAEIDRRRSQ